MDNFSFLGLFLLLDDYHLKKERNSANVRIAPFNLTRKSLESRMYSVVTKNLALKPV